MYKLLVVLSTLFWLCSAQAVEEMNVPVHDQELQVHHFKASGNQLMVWIMPRLEATPRVMQLAERMAAQGVEIWLVDLSYSLFLPQGPASLRSIDGRYVSGLIEAAHRHSGKNITLLARGYAAIPALKGARDWQFSQPRQQDRMYLNGVILISPDLYATIPALGLDPVYEAIVRATNVPMMIYQSGKRGNRWQLDRLVEQLQQGGAQVYTRVLPGVTGLFADEDKAPATLAALDGLPGEMSKAMQLLQRLPTPLQVAELSQVEAQTGLGLDTQLTPFSADFAPAPVDLQSARGERVIRKNYTGKVTVMNFWASWCPPCVEEIPSLNNLRRQLAERPFELISINYAEDPQQIGDFLRRVKVDFPVLLDEDGSYSAQWKVLVFPSTFVIGPDGRIVYGVNGAIHWDAPEVVRQLRALMPE